MRPRTEEELANFSRKVGGFIILLNAVLRFGDEHLSGTKIYSQATKSKLKNLEKDIEAKTSEFFELFDEDEKDNFVWTIQSFYDNLNTIMGDNKMLDSFVNGKITYHDGEEEKGGSGHDDNGKSKAGLEASSGLQG